MSDTTEREQIELDLGAWCILRMGSAQTISVATALRSAGFEVWTPVERTIRRTPISRTRFEKEHALMPSYVFAHVRHIVDLARLAMMPGPDHPRFTMFKHQGGFPLIADCELDALRQFEQRRHDVFEKQRRKGLKGPVFERGQEVRVPEGGFAGLTGVVQDQQGQYTLVSFAEFHKPIKIASILLADEKVSTEQQAA